MKANVLMSQMTWTDYQRRVLAGQPVLIAIGAMEQHGPHMTMAVDTMIPQAICTAVAEIIGAIVAAPLPYGYKSQPRSGGGNQFCGTASLDAATLTALIKDLLKEFARHGVRRIAIFDGHYENAMFAIEAIDLAMRELLWEGVRDLRVLRVSYWEHIQPETVAAVFPDGFPGWPLEHASIMETSVMLHLDPDLVDMSQDWADGPAQFPLFDVYPLPPGHVPPSGVLSTIRGASAQKGKLLFENYVEEAAKAVREGFAI
jgi:creatinine amidohydrolase